MPTKEGLLRQILGEHRHHQIDAVLTPNEKEKIYNAFFKMNETGVLNRSLIENIKEKGMRRIDRNYYPNNRYAGMYSYTNRY